MTRLSAMMCVLAVMLMVFVGCASNNNSTNQKDASTSNNTGASSEPGKPADPEKKQEATLRFAWWGSEVRHQALLAAIDKYMELNPHVTIEAEYSGFDGYYQKLITQFAGNTAPDLTPLSMDWINEIAVKGDLVMDLNTLQEYINLDAFNQEFLTKYAVHGGELVGLPMGVNGMVTVQNENFFEKFGIPVDTVWDWETIREVGKKVHEQDNNSYLLGMFDYRGFLQPYVNQITGNQWINEDLTIGFDEEAVASAFSYYVNLLNDGVIQPVTESSLFPDLADNLQWQNGNIGMGFSLASTITKFKTNVPELEVSMFPIAKDAKTSSVLVNPSNPLAINKLTKFPEEAAKFASWLLTDPASAELVKDVYSVPPVEANAQMLVEKSLIDATTARAVELALQRPGDPVNGISNNQEIAQIVTDIMQQVAFGRISPEQGAKDVVSRVTDKLKEVK